MIFYDKNSCFNHSQVVFQTVACSWSPVQNAQLSAQRVNDLSSFCHDLGIRSSWDIYVIYVTTQKHIGKEMDIAHGCGDVTRKPLISTYLDQLIPPLHHRQEWDTWNGYGGYGELLISTYTTRCVQGDETWITERRIGRLSAVNIMLSLVRALSRYATERMARKRLQLQKQQVSCRLWYKAPM